MTNLNSVITGLNQYCGPAVLSILTGKNTDECARVISMISGKTTIRAVDVTHLTMALNRLGFEAKPTRIYSSSLYGVLASLNNQPGKYMITVPRHVVMVEVTSERQIYFCDNHTKEPINAAASARLTQLVDGVWLIVEKPKPVEPKVITTSYEIHEGSGYISVKQYEHLDNNTKRATSNKGAIYFNTMDALLEITKHLHDKVRVD